MSNRAMIQTGLDRSKGKEFANRGHTGVAKEKGSYSLLFGWPERLGEDINLATPRPYPGADQKVVAALDELQTDGSSSA